MSQIGSAFSTADSRFSVWVIPKDEDVMLAQHTLAFVRP
jgi:acetate kinase